MGITPTRIAGQDRYETAVKIAQQIVSPTELFVVTGEDYPDALSIASIAALKQAPIILVPKDSMPNSVKSYISNLNVSKTYVVGYSDIISDSVCNQFSNPERIAAADKYSRNIAINQKFNTIFNSSSVCLATGEGFADALTGAVYASKLSQPIILINNDSSVNTKNYYQQRLSNATYVYVFGGIGILPDYVIQRLNSSYATKDVPIGEWNGTYTANQGETSFALNVDNPDTNGNYQAIFSFGPTVKNPNVPTGSFSMLGSYDPQSKKLNFKGVQWIKQPATYAMVDMDGTVDLINNMYKGTIIYPDSYTGSGSFIITRKN